MSITAQLSILNAAMTAAGAKYPTAVTSAKRDRDRALEAARALPAVTRDDITRRATTVLMEGGDPLSDPEMLRLTLAAQLLGDFGIERAISAHAEDRIVAALTEHAAPMVAALCKAADRAGAELTRAAQTLKGADLGALESILGLGPDGAEAWANAKRLVTTLRTLEGGWQAVAELTRFADSRGLQIHRLTDVDLSTRAHLGNAPGPWAIVQAGATIALPPDRDTLEARVDRHNSERAVEAATARQSFREGYRRSHGIALPR